MVGAQQLFKGCRMPKKRRGAGFSRGHNDQKHGNKDMKYEERKVAEWQARLEAKQKRHDRSPPQTTQPQARRRAAAADVSDVDEESEESVDKASESEKRVTVAYFYKTECHCAPEEDWSGRDGTIAYIRRCMGSAAPSKWCVVHCFAWPVAMRMYLSATVASVARQDDRAR